MLFKLYTGLHFSTQILTEHRIRTRREPSNLNTFIDVLKPSVVSVIGFRINCSWIRSSGHLNQSYKIL